MTAEVIDVKSSTSVDKIVAQQDADLDPQTQTLPSQPIEEATLSNGKLILLGTGIAALWGSTSAAILQTCFVLPTISAELHLSDTQAQWIAASFMLVWGCSQVIAGRLCDTYGRKRGLMLGGVIYIVFNAVSAFMPNLASLNVCRGFVGLSCALCLPASAGMVGTLYPPGKKRTWAFVAISCGGTAGAAFGQLVGGVFIEYTKWTWRACFMSLAIFTIYPLGIIAWLVPPDPPLVRRSLDIDWLGSALISVGLFLVLLALTLSDTSHSGWSAPYVPVILACGLMLLGGFALRQRYLMRAERMLRAEGCGQGFCKHPPPLIPSALLSPKARNVLMIYLASGCTWAHTDSFWTFASYYYFDVLQLSPFNAGLRLSVTVFSGTLAALVVATTISRVPPRAIMAAGCTISTLSPILFALKGRDRSFYKYDLWAILFVLYGTDSTIAAGSTIISQTASKEDQSVASGLFQTSCRLGFAVGLAICTLVRNAVERAQTRSHGKTVGLLRGLQAAFWTCAAWMVCAVLLVTFGMRGWHRLDKMGEEHAVESYPRGETEKGFEHPGRA